MILLLAIASVVCGQLENLGGSNHQTTTYTSKFHPLVVPTPHNNLFATPFFSPDYSALTTTDLVQNAKVSIDIFTPSYGSWLSSCSVPQFDHNDTASCTGCDPDETRQDPFPMFGAILNAVHNGIAVRILTNDFEDTDCTGQISALPFLALNGVEVRFYTSTSFMHAKYMAVDGEIVSISSVNWSKTSYTLNREAGVVFSGDAQFINDFTTSVYDADWNQAYPITIKQTYTSAQMAIITDTAHVQVTIPGPTKFSGSYITPKPTPIAIDIASPVYVSTSPDFAHTQLLYDIHNTTESFMLYLYEISEESLCEELLDLHSKGINLSVLVSYRINSDTSCEESKVCYEKLYDAGVNVQKSPDYYTFSHQKYWISDGSRVSWSTGNWASTDYPNGNSFPPYGKSGYKPANRDFTGTIIQANVAAVFANVFAQDFQRGDAFNPSSSSIQCGF